MYYYCLLEQDPEHPRAGMKDDLKAWCQQHHCEALAQLAVHEGSRETLLHDSSVVPALETVATSGLTQGARELASAALSALGDTKLAMVEDGQKHIMLSCEYYTIRVHPYYSQMSVASLVQGICSFCVHRPVECTDYGHTDQRVADYPWLCDVA